jgi:hypothetical protein
MKCKIYFCIIFTLFVFCNFSYAQFKGDSTKTKNNESVFRTIGDDLVDSFIDGVNTCSTPLHFKTKDWIITGTVILTTTAFYLKDESLRAYSKKNHNDANDVIMNMGTGYGELISPVTIGGGVYIYGLVFKDDYIRVTGRMVLESVLYSGIITNVIKTAVGRSRPYTNKGHDSFQPIQFNTENTSFPSGHSTVAFAISSVLANRINNTYASIGLYTLAGVTALSRVYKDKHWASDVILGSAIGYFVGDYISSNSVSLKNNKKINCNIYPGLNSINLLVLF